MLTFGVFLWLQTRGHAESISLLMILVTFYNRVSMYRFLKMNVGNSFREESAGWHKKNGHHLNLNNVWNGMCVKNNTIIHVGRASNSKRDCDVVALPILTRERLKVTTSVRKERLRSWSLLLLAATVRSFAHIPLGISERNTTISLWEILTKRAQFFFYMAAHVRVAHNSHMLSYGNV